MDKSKSLVSSVTTTLLTFLISVSCLLKTSGVYCLVGSWLVFILFCFAHEHTGTFVNDVTVPPTVLWVLGSAWNPAQHPEGVMSSRYSGSRPAEGVCLQRSQDNRPRRTDMGDSEGDWPRLIQPLTRLLWLALIALSSAIYQITSLSIGPLLLCVPSVIREYI